MMMMMLRGLYKPKCVAPYSRTRRSGCLFVSDRTRWQVQLVPLIVTIVMRMRVIMVVMVMRIMVMMLVRRRWMNFVIVATMLIISNVEL